MEGLVDKKNVLNTKALPTLARWPELQGILIWEKFVPLPPLRRCARTLRNKVEQRGALTAVSFYSQLGSDSRLV